MNQAWLNGRLASDPEAGTTGSNVSYASFAVALERGSGENKQTIFLDCVAFRQTADFVKQYFKKGDGINALGSINVRDWTDQSGVKHRKYEIIVSQVGFPQGGKARSNQNTGREAAPKNGRNGAYAETNAGASSAGPWDNF